MVGFLGLKSGSPLHIYVALGKLYSSPGLSVLVCEMDRGRAAAALGGWDHLRWCLGQCKLWVLSFTFCWYYCCVALLQSYSLFLSSITDSVERWCRHEPFQVTFPTIYLFILAFIFISICPLSVWGWRLHVQFVSHTVFSTIESTHKIVLNCEKSDLSGK